MAKINKEEAYIIGAAQKRFREEYQKKKRRRKIRNTISWILFLVFLSFVVINAGFLITEYHGTGMSQMCSDGDIVITNRLSYLLNDPARGEVVTIKNGDSYELKRIIGLPGDQIDFSNGDIYINNARCIEDYINGTTENAVAHVFVPQDSYFVLNDDREDSNDSRSDEFETGKIYGYKIAVIHVPKTVQENEIYQNIRLFCKSGAQVAANVEDAINSAIGR